RGAEALTAGKLVAFPTETVYGVGALATRAEAMRRLRELKGRPDRPFSVHLGRPEHAERYVRPDVWARRVMRRAWPGPLTLILPAADPLPDPELRRAGAGDELVADGWIGLRCPSEPTAAEMLAQVEGPVVASSANLPGTASPREPGAVLDALDGEIDLLIEAGRTRHGTDSTIARLVDGQLDVVRAGAYAPRQVRRLLRWHLLFVCTGNTCRSPLAAGLAKALLAERLGVRVGQLRRWGIEIRSAGVAAAEGLGATDEAVRAARRYGAELSHHRSRPLDRDLIAWADVILCMTDVHVGEVARFGAAASDKARRLDPAGDIPDPVGGGADAYRRTGERIQRALADALADVV
ncbi:MAG: L-threonylcarbamoyladenylate synthase, partial [Planctomycetota bacterium]